MGRLANIIVILSKVRRITRYINASPQRLQAFRKEQERFHGKILSLSIDCRTRWNSTYKMLLRVYQFKSAIEWFIKQQTNEKIKSALTFQKYEWRHVEYLLEILYEFSLYTTGLSTHTGVTVHQVYDVYDILFNHLEEHMTKIEQKRRIWKKQIYRGLQEAHSKLRKYYADTYGSHGIIYGIAIILNPCRKLQAFRGPAWEENDDQWVDIYRDYLKRVFVYYSSKYPDTNVPAEEEASTLQGLDRLIDRATKRRRLFSYSSRSSGAESAQSRFAELDNYLDTREFIPRSFPKYTI